MTEVGMEGKHLTQVVRATARFSGKNGEFAGGRRDARTTKDRTRAKRSPGLTHATAGTGKSGCTGEPRAARMQATRLET